MTLPEEQTKTGVLDVLQAAGGAQVLTCRLQAAEWLPDLTATLPEKVRAMLDHTRSTANLLRGHTPVTAGDKLVVQGEALLLCTPGRYVTPIPGYPDLGYTEEL